MLEKKDGFTLPEDTTDRPKKASDEKTIDSKCVMDGKCGLHLRRKQNAW